MSILASLASAIRRALAALRTMTWRVVMIGGRLVRMLIPSPLPPSPEEIVEDALGEQPDMEPTVDQRLQSIRELAYAMKNGTARSAQFGSVHEADARWLMAMPPEMLKLVVCTSDGLLRGHMNGRSTIKGLLAYDSESVAAYASAVRKERELEERRRLAALTPARYLTDG